VCRDLPSVDSEHVADDACEHGIGRREQSAEDEQQRNGEERGTEAGYDASAATARRHIAERHVDDHQTRHPERGSQSNAEQALRDVADAAREERLIRARPHGGREQAECAHERERVVCGERFGLAPREQQCDRDCRGQQPSCLRRHGIVAPAREVMSARTTATVQTLMFAPSVDDRMIASPTTPSRMASPRTRVARWRRSSDTSSDVAEGTAGMAVGDSSGVEDGVDGMRWRTRGSARNGLRS